MVNWTVRACATLVLVATLASASLALEWSGRIVDARTGEPLSGVLVGCGFPGRANLVTVTTGTDGLFRLKYPDGFDQNPGQYEYYSLQAETSQTLRQDDWASPPDWEGKRTYLDYERRDRRPTDVGDVELVPRFGYITGRVVDADSGQPLSGAAISLGAPGVGLHYAMTGRDGVYRLRVDAYFGSYGPSVETTPEASRPPEQQGHSIAFGQFNLSVNWGDRGPGAEYRWYEINPGNQGATAVQATIPVVSSADPSLHTRVDFRLPKKASSTGISANLVSIAPPTAAGEDVGLQDLLRQLRTLIAQQRLAITQARRTGSNVECSQQVLEELQAIRGALQAMADQAPSRPSRGR